MDPQARGFTSWEGVFCVHVAILQCHRLLTFGYRSSTDPVGVFPGGLAFPLRFTSLGKQGHRSWEDGFPP